MSAPEPTVLRARGLAMTRAGRRLFEDLSLDLAPGDFLGICGPNGCGKSTLLGLLAGWLRPQAGTLELGGRPLGTLRPRDRGRLLTQVGQAPSAEVSFAVQELVTMGRQPHQPEAPSRGAQAVQRALEATDLLPLSHRPLATLSGGELQRAFLARALAAQTPLLLLDEVSSAQDPRRQGALMSMLADLVQKEGRAIALATHDLNLASLFCTRVLLFGPEGAFIHGTPQEVFTKKTLSSIFGDALRLTDSGDPQRPLMVPVR
jgi:iron complex transport system ATP-binding protein